VTAIVLAVAPIFALIGLGWALRRWLWPAPEFWASIEVLTYYVFFPALLVTTLAQARLTWGVLPFLAVPLAATLAMGTATALIRPLLKLDGPAYTSMFQGTVRFNTYVGLAAASALFGAEGIALLALAIAVMIFPVNILTIAVLARHAKASPPGLTGTLIEIARNPIILSSAIGLALGALDLPPPPVIGPVLDILAKAALPLGLVAVGAGLNFGTVAARGAAIATSALLKLVAAPLVALAGAHAIGLEALALAIAVLYMALPPAPTSYILARRLGGDAELIAAIITVHTLLAALTIPLFMAMVRAG
jgi:malonate transporter and related proteins